MRKAFQFKLPTIVKNNVGYIAFVALISVLYGVFFTFSDFYGTPFDDIKDLIILSLQWWVVVVATFGLLWLLSVNKYIFAVCFPLLTVISSILAYFRYTARVSLTPMAIDLALVNDARTSMDVVSPMLIVCMLTALPASLIAVVYRLRRVHLSHTWLHLMMSVALITVFDRVWMLSNPVQQRIPYNVFYAWKDYWENRREIGDVRPVFGGKTVCASDSLTVVFVLGESLRAKNMQINGYERTTTPFLCQEKNAVSLPHIAAQYGVTHLSVPYILTRANPQNPDRAYSERSFVSLMKQAGYRTTWIANQESVSTFIYFMKECDSLIYVNSGKSLYVLDKWLDADMLPAFDETLKRDDNRNFILLHTIGSHWYYNSHFPDSMAPYQPVLKSKVISSNTHDEMRNAYDNTIVYSDYFWHQLFNRLRHRPAILIYLSDHAECMGEDGLYTHGTDHPALYETASFVWFSDAYARRFPKKVEALQKNKNRKYNASFLFHSILDAADIRSPYIQAHENIFQP